MATAEKKKRQKRVTPVGTGTFVSILTPKAMDRDDGKPGEEKYRITLVWTEEEWKVGGKELPEACIAAAKEKFGEEAYEKSKKAKRERDKIRMPWRSNEEYEDYGAPFDTPGYFCAFTTNKENPPDVVNRQAKPITNAKEVYAGMRCRVTYGVWPYSTNGNNGVTLFLNNVQKAGDGPKLAGRASGEEDFDEMDGGDGEEDDDDLDI